MEYQRRLREANALDFDDIILHTVRLLQRFEDVRAYYQRKFRYVLIDEYQDTNNLQYLLASTLAGGYENICVVGDDDQSIYRFRGATIENILSFEEQYKGCPGHPAGAELPLHQATSWRPPTPSSATTRAARARSCGPRHGAGEKVPAATPP